MTTRSRASTKRGKTTVGFVGLGIMGGAFAKHLCSAGFKVLGYDPVPAAMAALRHNGGTPASSAAEVAGGARVIVSSLPSVAALESALFGTNGVATTAKRGTVVIETSTFPLIAKEKAGKRLAKQGITLLDCPISGTGAQAVAKDAIVYVSGERAAYQRNRAVFDGFARNSYYCGPFGAGSKLKYIANLLVTIHNLSAAEAFVLAERAGLDLNLMHRVIGDGAGGSRMFQVRGPMMASREYLPATMKVDVYKKDTSIIDEFAKALRCPTPLFTISKRYHDAAMKKGYAKLDTAVVHRLLRDEARVRGKRR
jgi:putative dehydrogenase